MGWIDRRYDYVYDEDPRTELRGGEVFNRPGHNVFKLGLNVSSRYGGSSWLDESGAGSWPVSYHGTEPGSVGGIVNGGYRAGSRGYYGTGVYSCPDINVAVNFSRRITLDGKSYYTIMMNRVNPGTRKKAECTFKDECPMYWVTMTKDEGEYTKDLRMYAVLFVEEDCEYCETRYDE